MEDDWITFWVIGWWGLRASHSYLAKPKLCKLVNSTICKLNKYSNMLTWHNFCMSYNLASLLSAESSVCAILKLCHGKDFVLSKLWHSCHRIGSLDQVASAQSENEYCRIRPFSLQVSGTAAGVHWFVCCWWVTYPRSLSPNAVWVLLAAIWVAIGTIQTRTNLIGKSCCAFLLLSWSCHINHHFLKGTGNTGMVFNLWFRTLHPER